jgi:hypothetical protein
VSTEGIAIIGAVATVIAGFGGAALGACFAYKTGMRLVNKANKNAIDLIKIQEFNRVAAEFRSAFIEEYRFLNRECAVDRMGRDIPDVLSFATEKHEKAFIIFKAILPSEDQTRIQKAWDDYTGKDYFLGRYTFYQYTTKDKFKEASNIRQNAIDRLNTLLKFAAPK